MRFTNLLLENKNINKFRIKIDWFSTPGGKLSKQTVKFLTNDNQIIATAFCTRNFAPSLVVHKFIPPIN